MSRKAALRVLLVIVFMAIGVTAWFTQIHIREPVVPATKISIAVIPFSLTGYSVYIAEDKGYFRENGLDVTLKNSYPH